MTGKTPAERKAEERARLKALGMVRRDVWAHPADWPEIRKLERHLRHLLRYRPSDGKYRKPDGT